MTADERRARDRERKRVMRARVRAEREAAAAQIKARAEPAATVELPKMLDEVKTSLAAMKWLQPSDGASVAQAKALAAEIDQMTDAGETSKALSAHRALSRVLNDLGGTPTVRLQHELRSLKLGRRTGEGEGSEGVSGDEAEQEGSAIVSKFERPKKRARR